MYNITPAAPAAATATAAPTLINGPSNTSQGPATGDSTEHGDSWHVAVGKINAWFKYLEGKVSAPIEHMVTATDEDARSAIKDLEDQISALQKKHDDLVNEHAATAATVTAITTQAVPGIQAATTTV